MKCEANGCTEELERYALTDSQGAATGEFVTRVPWGWAVVWVERGEPATKVPGERLVVLCPMHRGGAA